MIRGFDSHRDLSKRPASAGRCRSGSSFSVAARQRNSGGRGGVVGRVAGLVGVPGVEGTVGLLGAAGAAGAEGAPAGAIDGGFGAGIGRSDGLLRLGVEPNPGGLGALIGAPGSFLAGVEPNPGGLGALIGSPGIRLLGIWPGAVSGRGETFGPGSFLPGVEPGSGRSGRIGSLGSCLPGTALGSGFSGLIGSLGSCLPGVELGVGFSGLLAGVVVGAVAGVAAGSTGFRGRFRLGVGIEPGVVGTPGGVACAKRAPPCITTSAPITSRFDASANAELPPRAVTAIVPGAFEELHAVAKIEPTHDRRTAAHLRVVIESLQSIPSEVIRRVIRARAFVVRHGLARLAECLNRAG